MIGDYKKKRMIVFCLMFFLSVSFVFVLFCHPAYAQNTWKEEVGNAIIGFLGWIFYGFAYVLGLLLTLVIKVLIDVAKFNHIIDVDAVRTGWVIVRDLSNMFFILVLLVIAFATILRIESYSMKRWLPKLLIMAVLINFSKTICGLIIDFAQVIMLTFVRGFGEYGENNLVRLFQINQYLAFTGEIKQGNSVGPWETGGAIIAGFFATLVTFIVMLVMLAILVFRVIMLWVYVILSPIAFLASSFPGGQRYSSQWWSEFVKQVIVGPVLAFFIWLALLTASQSVQDLRFSIDTQHSVIGEEQVCAGVNSLFCSSNFTTYIITIALLVGGLIVTQQVGAAAGAAADRGIAAIRKVQAIGVRGVRRISGYDAVADRTKAYMAMRRSAREDKIRTSTLAATKWMGDKKEKWISQPTQKGLSWVRGKGLDKWKKEAQEMQTKLQASSQTGKFEHGNLKYRYLAGQKQWVSDDKEERLSEEEFQAKIKEEIGNQEKQQKRIDKLVKYGIPLAGAGIAAATGGVSLGVLAGAAGFGSLAAAKKLKEAGKTDLKLASNYWAEQINKQRETLKLEDNETLTEVMNDLNKSVAERAAAIMELMSRKVLDLDTVKAKMEEVEKGTRGDKRVKAQLEAVAERNYPAATRGFKDPKEREDRFRDGTYTVDALDNGSIRQSSNEWVKGIKLSKFEDQVKRASGEKQDVIKEELKKIVQNEQIDKETRQEAIKKFGFAFRFKDIMKDITQEDKKELLQKINVAKLREFAEKRSDDNEEIQALKELIYDKGKGTWSEDLPEGVKNALASDTPNARNIRATLGLETKKQEEA